MKRTNLGFTLIELMIVVAIIGILAVVGIPQYQRYVARSQVAEGFSLAGGTKTALAEYHNANGSFPNATGDAHSAIGIDPAGNIIGKYVTGVEVSDDGNGTITATFGPDSYHDGRFLRLTATATEGVLTFGCTTDFEEPYRPKDCDEGTDATPLDNPGRQPWKSSADGNACWDQEQWKATGNGWAKGETKNPVCQRHATAWATYDERIDVIQAPHWLCRVKGPDIRPYGTRDRSDCSKPNRE